MDKTLWLALLNLKQSIDSFKGEIQSILLVLSEPSEVYINPSSIKDSLDKQIHILIDEQSKPLRLCSVLTYKNKFEMDLKVIGSLEDDTVDHLKFYLPYCLFSIRARQTKQAIAVSHFAQSLDGKIATNSGDSKWIGNQENLVHSHRMRALCDSILVGANTVINDRPKLTCRLVEGNSPKRILLCPHPFDYKSLLEDKDDNPPMVIGTGENPNLEGLDYRQFKHVDGRINCKKILQFLHEEGIYSVYVEGGALTTSGFLKDGAIDILQLHISPQLFGSGKSGIILPEIDEVKDSIEFERFTFLPIGDAYMFVGELNT